MALLDRLISVDRENLCAEIDIQLGAMFCGAEGVGAWVGIEYMAQAIAAYAGHAARLRGEPAKIGFLLGARRYDCSCPIFTLGSVLRVHVQRTVQHENGLGMFACHIDRLEQRLATATVSVFQPRHATDFFKESAV